MTRELHDRSAGFSPPPGSRWNVVIAPDRGQGCSDPQSWSDYACSQALDHASVLKLPERTPPGRGG
jgi:hypothetical protein